MPANNNTSDTSTTPATPAVPRKKASAAKKVAAVKKTGAPATGPITDDHKRDMAQLAANFMEAAVRNGLCNQLYAEVANLNKGLVVPLDIKRTATVWLAIPVQTESEVVDRYGDMRINNTQKDALIKPIRDAVDAALEAAGLNKVRQADLRAANR